MKILTALLFLLINAACAAGTGTVTTASLAVIVCDTNIMDSKSIFFAQKSLG